MLIYEPRGLTNAIANIGKMEISRVQRLLNKQLVVAELLTGKIVTAINIICLICLIIIIVYSHVQAYSSRHGPM